MKTKTKFFKAILLFAVSFLSTHEKSFSNYVLDWNDPTTYTVSCGSINSAQWTVKNDSCNFYTPNIYVGGTLGEAPYTVDISLTINQSGNLTTSDFAWIYVSVNGSVVQTLTVRGDTVSAVFTWSSSVNVPATGYMSIRVAMKTGHNTRFWQIKNGDISGNISHPLPVQLITFSGTPSQNSVLLSWTMASESDNDYFTVERSHNGRDFTSAGNVKASGTNHTLKNYSFTDLTSTSHTLYYRLMQTNYDGFISLLGRIITIEIFSTENIITVFPNPSGENEDVVLGTNNLNELVRIRMSNESGKIVYDGTKHSDSVGKIKLSFDSSKMRKGIYSLFILDDSGMVVSTRFIKI